MPKSITTVQEYIAAQPERTRERLEQLRSCLRSVVPHATEELRWGKPAFVDNGILFIYAAYKNHLSLHPTPHVIQALHHEMSEYISSENTIRFSLDCPIPEAIVIKISNLRVIHKEKGIGWK
jgi:uncharacterized protein YdhG (YjbR/CyaY superfamily)